MSDNSAGSGSLAPDPGDRTDDEVELAFERLVTEGQERLDRPLLPLVATGFLGGVDVGVGILAYLVVEHETGSSLLGALAFTVGFVALLMARSELFTENFLVPVTAVVARHGSVLQLIRLWVVTLVTNLAGGIIMVGLVVAGVPSIRPTVRESGTHYADLGVSFESFALAVLAGVVITLLTRMQHATDQLGVQIVPAVLMSFVLVGAQLFHAVLDTILMTGGLFAGQVDYTVLDTLGALAWSSFGNIVGGLVLVTSIRLLRVPHRVREEATRDR
ncbi:formate/nitrite transporter family protein [Jatrophihabitans sp. YIM 134969]